MRIWLVLALVFALGSFKPVLAAVPFSHSGTAGTRVTDTAGAKVPDSVTRAPDTGIGVTGPAPSGSGSSAGEEDALSGTSALWRARAKRVKSRGIILYVPVDDRPVSLLYPVDTLQAAGWEVQVPPLESVGSLYRRGDPDKLFAWLEAKAPKADAAVISSDTMLYGSLIDSRIHQQSEGELDRRVQRLLNFKKKTRAKNVYVYSTVMRSPAYDSKIEEPGYYAQWGFKIFRLGQLKDKKAQGLLSNQEKEELLQLELEIPWEFLQDTLKRRTKNQQVQKKLLLGLEKQAFDYLAVGKDDTNPFSWAHLEASEIEKLAARQMEQPQREQPHARLSIFAGCDEIGLLLMTRAGNHLLKVTPQVYTYYASGNGAKATSLFEDVSLGENVREHILAAGASPVKSPRRADFCLGVFLEPDGQTKEAYDPANNGIITGQERSFVTRTSGYLAEGKEVMVADAAFGNGSSKALVQELFQQKVAEKLASYNGWNTAGNTIGFTLGQGLLAPYMNKSERQKMLQTRYLEDWGYQANVRGKVYWELINPEDLPNIHFTPELKSRVEAEITKDMLKTARPLLGSAVDRYQYFLPWRRMFEVTVKEKCKQE